MATVKPTSKTLNRSRTNKVWLGVCGGLGDFMNIDPVVIRVVWIIITAFTGFVPGLVAYLVASLVMPDKA